MPSIDPILKNAIESLAILRAIIIASATDNTSGKIVLMKLAKMHILKTRTRFSKKDLEAFEEEFDKICHRCKIEPIDVDYR